MSKHKKGQGAMGLVILAVSIIIGVYMIGSIYGSIDQAGMPASVTAAIDDTLDNGTTPNINNEMIIINILRATLSA
jgi:hypothetical protein